MSADSTGGTGKGMSENDPMELADARDREADQLQKRSEELRDEVQSTRDDWRHKRENEDVPGAPPIESLEEGARREEAGQGAEQPASPAPQAPPPSEGPARAETASEGEAAPPASELEDAES